MLFHFRQITPQNVGESFRRYCALAVCLLALPAAEFLAMRMLVKHGLGLKFGWRYFTDFDFVVAAPLALALALLVLEKDKPLRFGWRWKSLGWNGLFLASFITVSVFFDSLAAKSATGTTFAFVGLALGTLLSGLLVMVRPAELVQNVNRWVWLPVLLLATAPIYGAMALKRFWPYFSAAAAEGACTLLGATLGDVSCLTTDIRGPRMIIRHTDLTIAVGRGCGGLDGFFLFALLIMVLWMIVPRWFTRKQWLLLVAFGLPLMYLLNVVRICSFFAFVILFKNILGFQNSVDVMLTLFHTHAGWVIFFSGILAYLRLADWAFSPMHEVKPQVS